MPSKYSTINPCSSLNASLMKFDIVSPRGIKWVLILLIVFIFDFYWLNPISAIKTKDNLLLLVLKIIIILLIIICSVKLWGKIGGWINEKLLLPYIIYRVNSDKVKHKIFMKILGLLFGLLGLNFDKQNSYFLEARVRDISIDKFWDIFNIRLTDVIFSSIGISMLIYSLIEPVLISFDLNLFNYIFYIVVISPVFIFWIVPIVWNLEDSQIRIISENGIQGDEIPSMIRDGKLSNILGYGGIIIALGKLMELNSVGSNVVVKLQFGIYYLILLLFSVTGTAYIITILYLKTYHAGIVNRFRHALNEVFPLGTTVVRKNASERFCIKCGAKNLFNAENCIKCGYSFRTKIVCPNCGNLVNKNKYCNKCGSRLI